MVQWCVSFDGSGEEDERGESLRAYLRRSEWVWNGWVKEIEKEINKYYFNVSGNKKIYIFEFSFEL